jgi:hypothetical protein
LLRLRKRRKRREKKMQILLVDDLLPGDAEPSQPLSYALARRRKKGRIGF